MEKSFQDVATSQIDATRVSSQLNSLEKQVTKESSSNLDLDINNTLRNRATAEEKSKKKYSVITQQVREKFINKVLSKEATIKQAAKEFGLKFSTSKAILQTYKKEGRIGKKKNRERKTRVVNTVVVAAINPFNSGIIPLLTMNQTNNTKLDVQNTSIVPISSNQIKEKSSIIENSLNQIQKMSLDLGFQQQILSSNLNQSQFNSTIPFNHSLGKIQPNLGMLNNNLSHAELKHQSLVNSILQGSNVDLNATNLVTQQLLTLQHRQQLQQYNMQQQQQTLLLQNLSLQNQLVMGMRDPFKGQIRHPAGNLNIGHSLPQELLSQTMALQNVLNLTKNSSINPTNSQELELFGRNPSKKICFGEPKALNFFY